MLFFHFRLLILSAETKPKDVCWTKENQLAFLETRDDQEFPNQIRICRWEHEEYITIGKSISTC